MEYVEKDGKKWLLIGGCYTGVLTEEEAQIPIKDLIKEETKSLVNLMFIFNNLENERGNKN